MPQDLTPSAPPQALTVPTAQHPTIVELGAAAAAHSEVASAYTIDSREMYQIAADTLADIQSAAKAAETARTSITDPLHKAWKNANALFKPITDALDQAKRELSAKMIGFEDTERARLRAAEEAAERRRMAELEAAAARVDEAERMAAEGRAGAETALETARTEQLVAEVATTAVVDVAVERGGHARVEDWKVEVTDLPALLRYVADNLERGDGTLAGVIPESAIRVTPLKALARDTQGRKTVPGVKFTPNPRLAARSK